MNTLFEGGSYGNEVSSPPTLGCSHWLLSKQLCTWLAASPACQLSGTVRPRELESAPLTQFSIQRRGGGGHGSIGCYAVAALQRMHCDLFCKVKQFWVTLRAMFERKTISGFLTERLMICSDTHGQAAPRRDLATCTTTHLETLTKAALGAAAGGPAATNVSSRLVAACQVFAWNWSCVWARP